MISRIAKTTVTAAALTTAAAGAAHAGCQTVEELKVCGNWQNADGGKTLSGTARIKQRNSNTTRFTLVDADLFLGTGGISGQASFALPSVAALGSGATGEVRGDVRIFTSAPGDDTVTVGDIDIAIQQGDSALIIDYAAGTEGNVGGIDVSAGNDGAVALVPDSKTFYIGGDFLNLPMGPVEVGALGISLDGAMTYHGDIELYDGQEWFEPTVEGGNLYVAGTIPFGRYPVALDGRAFYDWQDQILAAEGVVNLGYSLGAFDFSIPVGDGALLYEGGDDGALYAAGSTWQPRWFEGTPLEFLDGGQTQNVWAWFDLENGDVDDFLIGFSQQQVSMAGFSVSEFVAELSTEGIRVSGSMPVHTFGTVEVEGAVQANGDFELTGAMELDILGNRISNAQITFTNDGVDIEGRMRLPMGDVDVSGSLSTNGQLSLTGNTDLNLSGVSLSNADITVTNSGVAISATVSVPGFSARMSGTLNHGQVSMSARMTKSIAGFSFGNATFTVQHGRIDISDTYSFAGQNFSLRGSLHSNGHLTVAGSVNVGGSWTFAGTGASLSGSATILIHGSGNAHFSANASVRACGHLLGGKSCARKSASINSSGKISIRFPGIGKKTVDIL